MNELVRNNKGVLAVSTIDLYEKMGYKEHRTLKRVISDNISAFNDIGILHIERLKPLKGTVGGRPQESYLLTEDHFILLVLLAKNTPESVDLKIRVSSEFRRMKKRLSDIASRMGDDEWQKVRIEGKDDRRLETDVIKAFISYAKAQGGTPAGCDKYYANISSAENKALFIVEGRYPNLRDVLGVVELRTVQQADMIVARALKEGMDKQMHYKEIYKLAKRRVETFAEVRGVTTLSYLGENLLTR